MNGNFIVTEITPLGDPDSGESHIVTLHHGCKEGPPGVATVRFGSLRAGETTARCSECGATITVTKENGGADIYIREEE